MHPFFASFYTWFAGGLTSGVVLTKVMELTWNRWTQTSDRVREKKDAIGQEFNKIYLEGKGHGFRNPPRDEDGFRKIILDIEKYDKALSNKLAQCKSRWSLSATRANQNISMKELQQCEQWAHEAEKLADEVYEEIREEWII